MDSLLHFVNDTFRSALAFVVVLGVLVFIHEMGHYLAARWRGVHVEVFSIGFGKPIRSWTDKRGCQWRLSWLPLGGYVKLHGHEGPDDATPEQRAAWREGETFHAKPVRDRAIVIAAGPAANFLLAIVLFGLLYATVGQPVPTTNVGQVTIGSAADRAGLRAGDRILSLDGKPVERFDQVQAHIQPRGGQPVEIRLSRDGAESSITATPDQREVNGQTVGLLGIAGGAPEFRRMDPVSGLVAGVVQTWDVTAQTVVALGQMITGKRGLDELGGPLRIAQISGQVAQLGIASMVSFVAVLSINLGLMNLFPIPMLDGGHLVFHAVEAIRGKPAKPRTIEYSFRAGFALLMVIFVFATFNDLGASALGRWVAGLIG